MVSSGVNETFIESNIIAYAAILPDCGSIPLALGNPDNSVGLQVGIGERRTARDSFLKVVLEFFRALITIVSIGGAPAAGYFSDRLGRRWPVLAVTVLIGGIGVWLMSIELLAVALGGAFLAQLTGGGVEALTPAITGDRVRVELHGQALGWIYTLADLGSTLGPMITLGLLSAKYLSLTLIYQGSAILLILVIPFAILQMRKEPISTKG